MSNIPIEVIPTTITKDYCPHWSKLDALREFISNAVDSGKEWDACYNDMYEEVTITTQDTVLPLDSLLFGKSSSRGSKDKIGNFGEGLLLALGICAREGCDVMVFNGSEYWRPKYNSSPLFKEEVLEIEVNPYHESTKFEISVEGVSPTEWEQLQERCLHLQVVDGDNERIATCKQGRVFLDRKGKLYVGGMFVKDTNLEYTYDFNPQYLKLNRDRQSVDGWDLGIATAALLAEALPSKEVAEMIYKESEDTHYLQYNYSIKKDVAEECFNKYNEKYKGKQVVASSSDKVKLEQEGYSDIEVIPNQGFVKAVRRSESYSQLTFIKDDTTPVVMLENALQEVLEARLSGSGSEDILNPIEGVLKTFKSRGVKWI